MLLHNLLKPSYNKRFDLALAPKTNSLLHATPSTSLLLQIAPPNKLKKLLTVYLAQPSLAIECYAQMLYMLYWNYSTPDHSVLLL